MQRTALLLLGLASPTCALSRPPLAAKPPLLRSASRARPAVCQLRDVQVSVDARLDDKRTEQLFAWLGRAFAGDSRYNNLMLAFASIFGDHPPGSPYALLLDEAMAKLAPEDEAVGEPFALSERERGSLGAMGAGQWTGQFRTRPHALLDVRGLSSVDEWAGGLSRGARRTLAKAAAQDFAVLARPIRGGVAAPHSSLAHFRCVAEHEVRLLADEGDGFFDALGQAIGRYRGCTSQAGEIREYRDAASGKVLAFAHECRKGRVVRGQWFYGTDDAARRYVWFHSVHALVARAIDDPAVDVVDLGPSGTDAFSALKERYGFESVSDWHTVADYRGPFRYGGAGTGAEPSVGEDWGDLDPPDWLFDEAVAFNPRGP